MKQRKETEMERNTRIQELWEGGWRWRWEGAIEGALLQTYVVTILIRSVMEVIFIIVQYMIYGVFLNVALRV